MYKLKFCAGIRRKSTDLQTGALCGQIFYQATKNNF